MLASIKRVIKDNKEYPVYAFGGSIVALIQFSVVFLMTQMMHIWHMISYGLTFFIGTIALFFYHRNVTYSSFSQKHVQNKMARFFCTSILGTALTLIGIYWLADVIKFNYILAGIFSAAVIGISVYFLNKRWVFSTD